MAGGSRRLALGIGLLVIALFAGRWGSLFLTARLWEAQVSEAAAVVGTRWAILRGGLETGGVALAAAWFVINFLAAGRIALPPGRELTGPVGRLSHPARRWLLVGAALVLGIVVGSGSGRWMERLLLALHGVRYDASDTLFHVDLGLFVAGFPLWRLLYRRMMALVLPALLGVLLIHALGGTFRLDQGRPWLAPRARPQLALLLSLAALVLGWGLALQPFRLAAMQSAELGPSEFILRTTVAELEAVFAATAGVLSFLWGLRMRFVVALGGWVGFGIAVLAGEILVASRGGDTTPTAAVLAPLKPVDTIGFALRRGGRQDLAPPGPGRPLELGPSLWDAETIVRLAEADSVRVRAVVPGVVPVGPVWVRVWFVQRDSSGGGIASELLAIADDRTGPTGGPVSIRWGDTLFSPGLVAYHRLNQHDARPGAPAYDLGPAALGVALSSVPRRIAVAWALQVGAALRAESGARIAWRLDPTARLEAVVPFASWGRIRPRFLDGELYWEADGYLTAGFFPSSRQVRWHGRQVSLLRAAFLGLVRARTGAARVFLRPDADALARAWAEIARPLVEAAEGMPAPMRQDLPYPIEQFNAQAQVLQGEAWTGRLLAREGRGLFPLEESASIGSPADPLTAPFLNESGRAVAALLLGVSEGGIPRTVLTNADSTVGVGAPQELQQRWERFPFYQQLRDSVKASGADLVTGLIRYRTLGDSLIAYQPGYSVAPSGTTALVLVNVALGERAGAGRTVPEAWRNLRGEVAPPPVGRDVENRLEQARVWLRRAEDALRRGDLQEFGRAFGFLREILGPPGPGPKR